MSTVTIDRSVALPGSKSVPNTTWFWRTVNLFKAYVFEGFVAKRQIEQFYLVFGGHIFFQTLRSAVELDLFSKLRDRPGMTRSEIATALRIAEQPARVLLLGLVSSKMLKKRGDRYFNTLVSHRLLTRQSERNVISYVKLEHHVMYAGMPYFLDAIKKYGSSERWNEGLKAFPGTEPTLYERLSHDETLHKVFQDAMSELSKQTNKFLADNVDLSRVKYLVDIGGGDGTNIRALTKANPHLRASVFDLPSVAEAAAEANSRSELSDRLNALPGNCFHDSLPTDADAFLLSHFCTIWSKEKNQLLFKKCYDALPKDGKLIVFNMMQNDSETGPLSAAVGSPYFLTIATGEGMLYTWNEYEQWMRDAGFNRIERVRLPHDHGAIIAQKQ